MANFWENDPIVKSSTLSKIGTAESDNRNIANLEGTSSATGLYQMTKGTFDLVKNKFPEFSDVRWEDFKNSPDIQTAMSQKLLAENAKMLESKKLPTDDLSQYTVWFSGGTKLATAPANTPIEQVMTADQIAANKAIQGKTAGEVRAMLQARLEKDKEPSSGGMPWENDPILPTKADIEKRREQGISDVLKTIAAPLVSGIAGIPEAGETGLRGAARKAFTAPTDILNKLIEGDLLGGIAEHYGIKGKPVLPTVEPERNPLRAITEPMQPDVEKTVSQAKIPGFEVLSDIGEEAAQKIRESRSEDVKRAIKESEITGSIFKPSTISFGEKPSAAGIGYQALETASSLIPVIATALITKKPELATGVGGLMGTGEAVRTAKEHIKAMSDEELAQKSPEFVALSQQVGPEKARQIITDKAAETAGTAQGIIAAVGSNITSKLITGKFDDLMIKAIQNKAGRIAAATAAGMAEEGIQELSEGLAADLGIDKYVAREIGADSFANLVLGAIGGAGPGGVSGARAKPSAVKPEEVVAERIEPTLGADMATPEEAAKFAEAPEIEVTGVGVKPEVEAPKKIKGAIAEEDLETEEVPVAPTPKAASPEIAKIEAEIADVNEQFKTATPDEFTDLNDRLADLQDDLAKAKAGKPVAIAKPEEEAPKQLTEVEQRSSDVYKKILADNPDLEERFKESHAEEALDPSGYHEVEEHPNSKNLKVGDIVYEKGDEVPKYVVNIDEKDRAKLINSDGKSYGGWSDIEDISTKPIDYDYKFDFGLGPVNVNVNKWLGSDNQWQFELRGTGASETGFKSALGIPFEGKRGTKEFDAFVEKVAKANAMTEKEKAASKNRKRQQEKKEAKVKKETPKVEAVKIDSFSYTLPDGKLSTEYFLDDDGVFTRKDEVSGEKSESTFVTYEGGPEWVSNSEVSKDNLEPVKVSKELAKEIIGREKAFAAEEYGVELRKAAAEKETKAEANRKRQAEKKAAAEKAKLSATLTGNDLVDKFVPEQYKDVAREYVKANENLSNAFNEIEKIKDKDKRQQYANEQLGPRGVELDVIGRKLPEELLKFLRKGMETKSLNEQQDIILEYEKSTTPKKEAKKLAKKAEKPVKEVHIEGGKSEPVTSKTIEEAIQKAATKVDFAKLKKDIGARFDKAIKDTSYATNKDVQDAKKFQGVDPYVTIDIPGDGKFKVLNSKERLEEIKKKLVAAAAPKERPAYRGPTAAGVSSKESAFKNLIDEKEFDAAIEYANITKLDISKAKLTPDQSKALKAYIAERKDQGLEPMQETIKAKPGANVARIAKMLGPQLYGSMEDIASVSVKEMIQNSFDAIKTLLEKRQLEKGSIDIKMYKNDRTISMLDNGSGMSPDVLANTFLTIAGTKKETEFGSGGFGIAKMLFLFGNKSVEVTTMRDGKISHMKASGDELMRSLEDPTYAPDIEVTTAKESPRFASMFPEGHGTYVKVTVPETYKDQSTGEIKKVEFDDSEYAHRVLNRSPLFANIDVKFNGRDLYIGSRFPAEDYTTFADAKFDWGTARIYVSNSGSSGKYGDNLSVLSNGLWQFSSTIKKNPMDVWGPNVPHEFYLDIVSKVKPDEEGYPFQLNRQGLTKNAEADFNLIKNYLVVYYNQKDYSNTSQNFGRVQYLTKDGNKVNVSVSQDLAPSAPKDDLDAKISEGAKVEVKDGKLIVNGKVVPALTPDELKAIKIDADSLRIDQNEIDPNTPMIHDNLEVPASESQRLRSELENTRRDLRNEKTALEKDLLNAFDSSEKYKIQKQINDIEVKIDETYRVQFELPEEKNEGFASISELARKEFGDRFDSFMFDIGNAFKELRDVTADVMKYPELKKEAVGVSFDKEYRGVSILIPFKGLYLNPAFPEFVDTAEDAGYGFIGTMIHELAHHKVRSHNADFPAEMQRITLKLKSAPGFNLNKFETDFVKKVGENMDIINFLNKTGSNEKSRPIGQRFKDGSQQATGRGDAEDLAESGRAGRRGSELPSELRPSYQAIGKEQQPKPVSSEGSASEEVKLKVKELLEKHNRPDAPVHPSDKVADKFMGGMKEGKKIFDQVVEDPLLAASNMIGQVDRAVTYARNKNVWYGTGLEQADFARYQGQLRDSEGQAIASVALTNAIHAGHVGTQVMIQGGLEFDEKTQMFKAVEREKSMANVVIEKANLIKKLGEKDANKIIQGYFEAKRSKSIVDEYLNREAQYESSIEAGEDEESAKKNLDNIEKAISKVNMTDEEIEDFIKLDKQFPELRIMMDNWTAVNHNLIDNMVFSGVINKRRGAQLKSIKDYVPWYRIMDDQEDVHTPTGGLVKTMTNVGQDKKFKEGSTDRDIDDIVDNMIHNVMMMTKNSMRNYAANRIAAEYGTRNEKGKLKVFPKEGTFNGAVRANIIVNGRRIVIEIKDPLVAESVIGMENIEIPMTKILGIMANGLRRSITFSGVFQVKQLFMDAPTASWVSGVKNPFAVWGGTFSAFLRALKGDDQIVKLLKSHGIGGFQSSSRTPEKELKLEIGLLNKSNYAKFLKFLDHVGDSSDYAQRVAVYKRVLKETGDEMQALIQANNVIDFMKHGSGSVAQFLTRTVSFMNAYAQQIDVLAQTLAGGGLKGMKRQEALGRMLWTGSLLSMTTLLYCMAVGDDDEYNDLDDQTKVRNLIIPGSKKYFGYTVALPMHTSASFIFKAIPELLYNKIMKEGTENAMDQSRLRKALKEAALDSLLGPNAVPTGAKPFVEIALNRNFFTGGNITPQGMKDVQAAEQYNAQTSELGKIFSALTSIPGTDKRVLNPMDADHLMRSLFGSVGAMAMWSTNMLAGDRPDSKVKDIPVIGQFVLPEVPRGKEDLFYDLKEKSDEAYNTYMKKLEREKFDEAEAYLEKYEGLIAAHAYVVEVESALKDINAMIRRLGETSSTEMTKKERREGITEIQRNKNELLQPVLEIRREAGM